MGRVRDWLPFAAGLLVCVITVQLGLWQTRRAQEKAELGALLDAGGQVTLASAREWQSVSLRGRWKPEAGILLDNRVRDGRPGYEVLTPLQTLDGEQVLVKRGWLPAGRDRGTLPEVATPAGEVGVGGRVRHPEAEPFTLAAAPGEGRLWQYLDLAAYRQWSGLAVAELVIEQSSPAADGLRRDWPRPDLGVDRHRGYAVQWFGLAALAAGLCGWFLWKRWKRE